MDRIEAMRVFARVAERRSFTLAAEDLGLPRSTVTDAVKQLEKRLGVRLLGLPERVAHLPHRERTIDQRQAVPLAAGSTIIPSAAPMAASQESQSDDSDKSSIFHGSFLSGPTRRVQTDRSSWPGRRSAS